MKKHSGSFYLFLFIAFSSLALIFTYNHVIENFVKDVKTSVNAEEDEKEYEEHEKEGDDDKPKPTPTPTSSSSSKSSSSKSSKPKTETITVMEPVTVKVGPDYITVIDPGYDTDTDKDGLVDAIDPNPDIAQTLIYTDTDGDTVPDAYDKFPGEDDFIFVDFQDLNNNGINDSLEPFQ